jgi:hypothetical protein
MVNRDLAKESQAQPGQGTRHGKMEAWFTTALPQIKD